MLPVALCALGGHLVLYRSLRPAGGEHTYLAWYEPLVAGLSLAALATFAGLLLTAFLSTGRFRQTLIRLLLPAARPTQSITTRTARLALAASAFLVVQETLERSIAAGQPVAGELTNAQTIVLLSVLVVLATTVALIERSCSRLVALVVAPEPRAPEQAPRLGFTPSAPAPARRRKPLAELRGLRAPPLLG
jgi:hypothetical protein